MHQTATKNYDLQFKDLVEKALDEANSDNAVWVSHEQVADNRKGRMRSLLKKEALIKLENLSLIRKLALAEIDNTIISLVGNNILNSRNEIISFLEESGIEVTRKSKNFISVRSGNWRQSLRLKGLIYREDRESTKKKKESKTQKIHNIKPTKKEYENPVNLCPKNTVIDNWVCPSCDRSLAEITRWNNGRSKFGYILHRHHDHKKSKNLLKGMEYTLICETCNKVDVFFKVRTFRTARELSIDINLLTENWSFTVGEIKDSINESLPHTLKHSLKIKRGLSIAFKKSGLRQYLLDK